MQTANVVLRGRLRDRRDGTGISACPVSVSGIHLAPCSFMVCLDGKKEKQRNKHDFSSLASVIMSNPTREPQKPLAIRAHLHGLDRGCLQPCKPPATVLLRRYDYLSVQLKLPCLTCGVWPFLRRLSRHQMCYFAGCSLLVIPPVKENVVSPLYVKRLPKRERAVCYSGTLTVTMTS